jgi:hypothetical protein
MRLATVFAAAVTFLAVSASPAAAQNAGIAFVVAPEQATAFCLGDDPGAAFDCAVAKCAEQGAAAEDCAPVAWCMPAGWTAGIGVMHKEGIHWTEYSCGWETLEAAKQAAQVRCDQQQRPYVQECSAGVFYDPDGNEIAAE